MTFLKEGKAVYSTLKKQIYLFFSSHPIQKNVIKLNPVFENKQDIEIKKEVCNPIVKTLH